MKTILITSDFSENSIDAAHAGIELARLFHAKVILMHVYSLPLPTTEFPEMIDFSAYEGIKKAQLEQLKKKLSVPDVEIETFTAPGMSFYEEVQHYAEHRQIDLIVLGLTGSSRMSEILLGSNTMSLLAHASVPVLAIPKGFSIKDKLNIAFAYDGQKIENQKNMDLLREMALKLNTKIHAFHVAKEKHDQVLYERLKSHLPFERFTLETEINDHTDPGILEYVTNNKIDILALIPRKYKFFDRLFHESHTREIAEAGSIPILALPD
ncbi:MAG: universal stress protein [Crocinitomicaceae bacterium]|jgi:nucleotide-binding universal stress UspA family protein|nr:universal stress protein [Crocinitomicaceae bacterium]